MNIWELPYFVSPTSQLPLRYEGVPSESGEIHQGLLQAGDNEKYNIVGGVPDFILQETLSDKARTAQAFYDGRSETYDQYLHLTFYTHGEDEATVRNGFIDLLELKPDSKVLEVAAGSGRDSEIIVSRLGDDGKLFLQDISAGMLGKARERLRSCNVPISYSLANATSLPYARQSFDCVFSFGGLGEFPDIRGALAEMVRVCKPSGKIVVGDESIPIWWRNTEFAKILSTTNPQFMAPLPLDQLPVEAREVCVRWVIGGVFYLIDFRVGNGPPKANFDYPIPGPRGGTYRTRYEGQLEGVTPKAKELAHKAREKRGLNMHAWLEEVVRNAATRDLQ